MAYLIKCVLIGSPAVGKTTLVYSYMNNKFKDNLHPTLGVDFCEKQFKINEEDYRLQLWDTAGQERYRSISKSYYRHSHCVLYCFSLTDKESFNELKKYIDDFITHSNYEHDVVEILVGTFADKKNSTIVTKEEINKLMTDNDIKIYYDVSAVDGTNINELFNAVINNVRTRIKLTLNPFKTRLVLQKENEHIKENNECCFN